MVRHTLKSLGPKVLADRMVRDYVQQLYTPGAPSPRALNGDYEGAARARAWKQRVRAGWARRPHRPRRVQRRRRLAGGRSAARRCTRSSRLGELVARGRRRPGRYGRVRARGRPRRLHVARRCSLAESYEAGRHRFEGEVALRRPARSATRCASCPRNGTSPRSPSSAGRAAVHGRVPLSRRTPRLPAGVGCGRAIWLTAQSDGARSSTAADAVTSTADSAPPTGGRGRC